MSVTRKLITQGFRTGYLFFSSKPTYFNFISRSVSYTKTACYHWTLNNNNNNIKTFRNLQTSCQLGTMAALSPLDPSSFSRPEIAIIKHISLFYDVIFDEKILHGVAELNFDVLKPTSELILDVKDLTIHSIELKNGEQLKYEVTNEVPNFGSKLTVNIPNCDNCSTVVLRIKYTTSPNASALQWLSPSQTSGKTHPYMFSQCQPIHARSILPCQDTPAVKFTYEAEVVAPKHFTALMSALRQEPVGNKTVFRQPVPIPSYLLAIAVAVLDHRRLGPRSLVWTEKEEIEASAWEFAETEKYLQAAEALCGPYQWTQYDLLVLPPSFPYGGMENPCLTFVTPTLLAGDRSQADVIVHEIMHSWTGNLVTNRNFEHFWLNEGFTVFLERKVGGSLSADKEEGRKKRDFESIQGLSELQEAIDHFGSNNPLTSLVVDLNGVHPDDSFSRVPYEKGSLFLRYLEDLVGGPDVFDDFLRKYLNEFQRRSLDTDQFKELLLTYFKGTPNYDVLKNVDWDTWLNKSGMPPTIPNYDASITKQVNKFVDEINQGNNCSSDVSHLTARQMIYFLQQLLENPPLSTETLQAIGETCNLANNHNSEIKYRWLRLQIRSRNKSLLDEVFQFINSQGRMKYVRPIYRDLYAWEEVRQQAIDNFLANEQFMMHVSAYTVRKDLHLQE